ncbi:MAG: hypothetical protein KC983_09630, partial [Phycisphaerales bacterium]|nr:hypothetical protein [Phycisphaerales bacterium]
MTSHHRYPLAAALIVVAAAIVGCNDKTAMKTNGDLLTQSDRPEVIAPVKRRTGDDTATTMDDLSQQMAADAAFLDRLLNEGDRSGLATPPGDADPSGRIAADARASQRPSTVIRWDGPNGGSSAMDGSTDAATPALGSPEPEFKRSAIFTDPDAFHATPVPAATTPAAPKPASTGTTSPNAPTSLKP